MSATLDGERLARFLDAPRLSSAGRSFPVQVAHFPARREETMEVQARRATEEALARHPGDVLVFLPGQREIARVGAALEAAVPAGVEVLALHGELPVEQQSKVLQPAPDGRILPAGGPIGRPIRSGDRAGSMDHALVTHL